MKLFALNNFKRVFLDQWIDLKKTYAQFLNQNEQTTQDKMQLITQASFELKKEIDKIMQNLTAIKAEQKSVDIQK